ncbi:MAG TPA: penicillin acylase family protein [Gemmatimonadaceae bacterium]|nr:penicillin acylase family protein [Gemmatimonadaceae bacterium]
MIRSSRRVLALALLAGCAPVQSLPSPAAGADRLEARAQQVTITRDDWGIAHIRARTDADAVFGMMYAQAEDDFARVEANFINAMGRLAEAEGESAIYQDLRMKLFIDPDTLKQQYAASPPWLRSLMDAWADGLNYYLDTHPDVTPRVITRFEPWMALSFSEGSIGGDIERISIAALGEFYGKGAREGARTGANRGGGRGSAAIGAATEGSAAEGLLPTADVAGDGEPRGSNGIAIAPSNTTAGDALLLINPHTSFFFRAEQQVTSDEGLDVYGASTWGQFFVYQGFNERLGWMHTSSGVDVIDEFAETIVERGGRHFYKYGSEERPVVTQEITVPYRTAGGAMAARTFTVYRTHHGPVVREADGKWVSIALMHKPVAALTQSFLRTKARDFESYMRVMELKANSSNNTIYADADGVIAYLHPQFVPRRDDRFDYTRPVEGSDPATDWKGEHALGELPFVKNPSTGWIQNTNNWPYSAAGPASPKREQFPRYMDVVGENARGMHAMQLLDARKDFSIEALRAAAYDPHLPAFAQTIPTLIAAWDTSAASSPFRARLAEQIALLRAWDHRWDVASVPTSLAVFWAEEMTRRVSAAARRERMSTLDYIATRAAADQKLDALVAASDSLTAGFGSWRTPWGEINRFQRLTGDIVHPFTDAGPSIPVGFTSGIWGSLASFGARAYPATRRRYGTSGNSFVAVVQFGDSVRARAVSAGGQSGHPSSPHFNDQAQRYATGALREVYFYPAQLAGHVERTYRPGQEAGKGAGPAPAP